MAPKKKLPVDQQEFIELWMPEYLLKRAAGKSDEFWIKMKTVFFIEWPEEVCLNLPVQQVDLDVNAEPPRRLTADEKVLLDKAIAARIGQLKNSFRNAYAKIRNQKGGVGKSVLSLAALLFKSRPKARRRHQVLELYHKLFKSKVHAALQQTEYKRLNEAAECRDDDGVWVDDDDDEAKMRRVTNTRSQRMKVMRRVVQELWDAESEVLRQEVREAAAKEVVVPEKVVVSEGEEGANVERTPEEYQMSIDESLQVAQMFLGEFQRMTGWMGALVYGGPVPQHKGAFGVKCVPFGSTPEGLTFNRWHPNWKKKVTDPLVRFLRQAIPTSVLVVTAAPAVTPVWTSPLAHQLSTPRRPSSVPAQSSPLTRPPLQADSLPRAVTPPPVESLPPPHAAVARSERVVYDTNGWCPESTCLPTIATDGKRAQGT
ncbi:hypothetical protein C8R44DRAFT_877188 [Mycena epipterygia]|nr:hypothetical protein C8R44DRAFT_877188 [Mycena epipterygia]